MNWVYLPPWSIRVVAALIIGLLALAVVRRWREQHGALSVALRASVILVLLFVMLNPQSWLSRQQTEKPKLVVLLDTSASMATRDVDNQTRMAAALHTLNPATLAALNKEFVVELRQFDRDTRTADLSQLLTNAPAGDASDVGRALMSAVSELGDAKSQAGVIMVSDGR